MMTTFLLVLVLLGLVMVMLAISILFKKNGQFPNTHIEDNAYLKKMGITCAAHDEYECSCSSIKKTSSCDSCAISNCTFQK